MVDIDAQRKFSGVLERGEKLIWTGTPERGLRFLPSDLLLIPFSLVWAGIAFAGLSSAIKGGNLLSPGGGISLLFSLIGVYIVLGRFFWDAIGRANTLYGVTDQRAIIRSGVFSKTFNSVFLRTLSDISLNEKSDGSGTIVFGTVPASHRFFARSQWPGYEFGNVPFFDRIQNVRQVYDQILRGRRASIESSG